MNYETDSSKSLSLSSSEQERKNKKISKKFKKEGKQEKKYKKGKKSHKERKRSYKEFTDIARENNEIQIQKPMISHKNEENTKICEENDIFGPVLPPQFLNNKVKESEPLVIGPIIPKELLGNLEKVESQKFPEKELVQKLHHFSETKSEDFQNFYGPLPSTNDLEITPTHLKLEHRALELKMAAMDGVKLSTSNQNVREEWMLELPDVGLKGGLAALNHLKRAFHQGKEKPDFSDRSSWTKTPSSRQEQERHTSSKKELQLRAKTLLEHQRDAEQESIAKEHKRKHERKESLVEMHQKKLRKEKKKLLKELRKGDAKQERRPFTRDVDLKLNKIVSKQIVDKAKILNTKFSSGQSKYL